MKHYYITTEPPKKIDKAEEEKDEQYTISNFDYKFLIGHSRRVQ